MDPTVLAAIERLTETATRHDASKADRLERWRVLEPDAGRFLWFLTQAVVREPSLRSVPRAVFRRCGSPMPLGPPVGG